MKEVKVKPRRFSLVFRTISPALVALFALAAILTFCTAAADSAACEAQLLTSELTANGFERAGQWQLETAGKLKKLRGISRKKGVYVFLENDAAKYVGLATMGLSKRLDFYARPGKGQSTNIRINSMIRKELSAGRTIEIYTASPPNLAWNGFPVEGNAGLELGLIEKYCPPWNDRGIP